MVNLLKFKDKAEYSDGRESDLTGEQAYGLYGTEVSKLLLEFGGGGMFSAEVERMMLGEVEELWDKVAIAMYPSREAMLNMMQEISIEPRIIVMDVCTEAEPSSDAAQKIVDNYNSWKNPMKRKMFWDYLRISLGVQNNKKIKSLAQKPQLEKNDVFTMRLFMQKPEEDELFDKTVLIAELGRLAKNQQAQAYRLFGRFAPHDKIEIMSDMRAAILNINGELSEDKIRDKISKVTGDVEAKRAADILCERNNSARGWQQLFRYLLNSDTRWQKFLTAMKN